MKYHRFYKTAAQALRSLYVKAAWQTEEAAKTDLLTELFNKTDEHRFRQILDGLSDEKFKIAKIYFCGEE